MELRRAPSVTSSSRHGAGVHAGAAEQHLALAPDGLQHALEVVVAVRRLLAGLGADHGVAHEEDA